MTGATGPCSGCGGSGRNGKCNACGGVGTGWAEMLRSTAQAYIEDGAACEARRDACGAAQQRRIGNLLYALAAGQPGKVGFPVASMPDTEVARLRGVEALTRC